MAVNRNLDVGVVADAVKNGTVVEVGGMAAGGAAGVTSLCNIV